MNISLSSVPLRLRFAAPPGPSPRPPAPTSESADGVETPHRSAQPTGRWRHTLATCALTLATSVSLPILAASPGLPFTEDFSDTSLRDDARTHANWSPEEQAVYLAWSTRRQVPLYSEAVVLGSDSDVRSVALGDIDGDGDLDLVEGSTLTTNKLFLNDGNGGFSAGIDVGNEVEITFKVLLGDVDRDGDLDLIVGNLGESNRLYLNDGSGGFPATGTPIGSEMDGTSDLAIGDVDGDGDLDLIAGNSNQTSKLYLNNGSGVFPSSGIAIGPARVTRSVVLGDIDGDGDLDLIVGNSGQTNTLFLNDGSGGFSGSGIVVGTESLSTESLALGDVDGDGDLDLVETCVSGNAQTNRRFLLYRNDGSGGFPSTGTAVSSNNHAAYDVAVADIDVDGDLDLVTSVGSGVNRVYLNDGSGGFVFSNVLASSLNAAVREVATGDLDGDGDLDLAFADGAGSRVFLNEGHSQFDTAGRQVGSESDTTVSVALGDLDGDGHLDVLAGDADGVIKRYLNDGDGGFAATGTDVGAGDSGPVFGLALGDLDSDGDLDLIAGRFNLTNRRYLNDGSGGFSAGVDVGTETDGTQSVALGDIDRDGDLDFVVGNAGSGQVNRLYLNDGAGGFPATGTAISADAHITSVLALGDLNGDGHLDVVAGNRTSSGIGPNRFYLSNGAGGFSAGANLGNENEETYGIALGDLDGDGDLDVMIGNAGGSDRRYLNNGSAVFSASGTAIGSETDDTFRLALGDVDGDGDLDLIAGKQGSANLLYQNTGSGSFSSSIAIGSETDDTWTPVLGDLDRDGDLDLVVGNFNQTNKVYMNGSRGAFRPPVTLDADADDTRSIAIGDVDRDGDLDVIVGNNGQTNKLYLNDGGSFPLNGTAIGSQTDNTRSVVLGDLDKDGDLDLIAGNSGQTNKRFMNLGGGIFSAGAAVGTETDATTSLALGDLDRDGDLDLVVGNASSQVNRRYMNTMDTGSIGFAASSALGSSDTDSTQSLALGDIDGDGHLDVVVGNSSATNKRYLNDGGGDFPAAGTNIGSETNATLDIALGDLDGDGDLDVIAGNDNTSNKVYFNDSDANYSATGTAVEAVNDFTSSLALADIDLDGDLDLIVGNNGQRNRLYLNDGNGGFTGTGRNLNSDNDFTSAVALADVDRDGDFDLIVGDRDGAGNTGNNRLLRYESFTTLGGATSTTVNTTPNTGDSVRAVSFAATASVNTAGTRNTGIDYYLSNNGGANWYRAYSGEELFFPASGTDLRWKAELRSLSPTITPMLTQIAIDLVPTVPEAPSINAAVALDASAEVLFGVVPNNGSPITGYTATSDPDNISAGCIDSPCIVTGLTNGIEYTFTLTATNGVGTGPASEPSNPVTPKAPQVIVFGPIPIRILADSPIELSATGGDSGNPVTFTSLTEAVCIAGGTNGSTVTLLALGTCTIRASQAGSAEFNAAADVDRSFEVLDPFLFADGFESDT